MQNKRWTMLGFGLLAFGGAMYLRDQRAKQAPTPTEPAFVPTRDPGKFSGPAPLEVVQRLHAHQDEPAATLAESVTQ